MVEEILISVIIPTYNRKEKLLRAVKSVRNQSYGRIELIVIDDNSDMDIRQSVVNECKSDIKYYKNDTNRGANYCRAKGVDLASGKYVLFLDSDDELLPTACEKLINKAEKNGCGAVFPSFEIMKEGSIQQTKYVEPKDAEVESLYKNGNTLGGFTGSFFNRSLLAESSLFDFKLDKAQDIDMYIEFLKLHSACTISDVIYHNHRDQHERISNSPNKILNGNLRLLHKHHDNFTPNHVAQRLRSIGVAFLSLNELSTAEFYFDKSLSQNINKKQKGIVYRKIGAGYLNHGYSKRARRAFIYSFRRSPSIELIVAISLTFAPTSVVKKVLYYRIRAKSKF